eukprot:1140789-Pelagomonas_calceolata.AAC.1
MRQSMYGNGGQLTPSGVASTTQYVRGVGGSTNTRVEMVDLPWIEVAGVRCHKVKCLYAKGISGLDISIYSAGILGARLGLQGIARSLVPSPVFAFRAFQPVNR